jgi:hypothetical protein
MRSTASVRWKRLRHTSDIGVAPLPSAPTAQLSRQANKVCRGAKLVCAITNSMVARVAQVLACNSSHVNALPQFLSTSLLNVAGASDHYCRS